MSQTTDNHRYAVIMAGGSGTRLWPMSRQSLPKQIQKFIGDKTLINETVERLTGLLPVDAIYIATTVNYADKIRELLPEIPQENIIVEPIARGTTAGLALATSIIYQHDPEASIFYLASDHSITGVEQFQEKVNEAYHYVAENPKSILLIGIKPTFPNTGLGYIKKSQSLSNGIEIYSVEKFVEKPTYRVAKRYIDSGDYYWNAAYYCFRADTLLEAYSDAADDLVKAVQHYLSSQDPHDYHKVPVEVQEIEIIDSSKYSLVVMPADFGWSDIGNWQSLYEVLSQMQGNNLVSNSPRHIDIASTNCLIFSNDEKLVATLGLDNIAVVNTPDVLLVLNKNKPQEIKTLLENLKAQGLSEYL